MKEQFEVIVTHLRTLQIRYGRSTDPRYFICRAGDNASIALVMTVTPSPRLSLDR